VQRVLAGERAKDVAKEAGVDGRTLRGKVMTRQAASVEITALRERLAEREEPAPEPEPEPGGAPAIVPEDWAEAALQAVASPAEPEAESPRGRPMALSRPPRVRLLHSGLRLGQDC